MPTSPYEPIQTILDTDLFATPTTGRTAKQNANWDKRHWRSGGPAKTAAYTVAATDELILTDTVTTGAFQIDLPSAASVPGMSIIFKQISTGTNICTIAPDDPAETIDGATSNTSLNAQYDVLHLHCDGEVWHVLYQT